MKLSQLEYFHTACRLGSITRAAEALHISQPSISEAIRRLEDEFGYALLDRQGKRFALTTEGAIFYAEADKLLSHVDAFEQSMSRLTDKVNPISLGVPPMIGSLLLPSILSSQSITSTSQGTTFPSQTVVSPPQDAAAPQFHLNISEGGRHELLARLASNELDMAFIPHDRPLDSCYRTLPLASLETVCCVPASHPLALQGTISPADLIDTPLVLFKESFFQTQRILAAFEEDHITPNILLETSQLSTVQRMVRQHVAVGFLFRQLADSLPDVASVPFEPRMNLEVSLVWRSTDYLPQDHLRFITHLRELAAQGRFSF